MEPIHVVSRTLTRQLSNVELYDTKAMPRLLFWAHITLTVLNVSFWTIDGFAHDWSNAPRWTAVKSTLALILIFQVLISGGVFVLHYGLAVAINVPFRLFRRARAILEEDKRARTADSTAAVVRRTMATDQSTHDQADPKDGPREVDLGDHRTRYSPFIENPTADDIEAALKDGRLTVEEIIDPVQDLAPLLILKTDDELRKDAAENPEALRYIELQTDEEP